MLDNHVFTWYNTIRKEVRGMWNTIKEMLYIVSAIVTVAAGVLDIIKHFRK